MDSRPDICRATAEALRRRRGDIAGITAIIGFDGFVDEICDVVDKRGGADVQTVQTITSFAEKIACAAGQSSNFEIIVRDTKIGGNGPIMSNALAALGMKVTCVGSVGHPHVHPVFAELATRAEVVGIADPAHTDALEFADGKLMFGKLAPLEQVTWENIIRKLGADQLEQLLSGARLIGMVNWTMIPQMSRIWAKLISDVLPELPELRTSRDRKGAVSNPASARRMIFIDLADPEKRTRDDLLYALKLLSRMNELVAVTLGMNLKEAHQVCGVLGLSTPAQNVLERTAESAAQVREALKLECCVIHPRNGAAAATAESRAIIAGPFVRDPAISTGAGDHFNAGFMLGRLLDLPLEQCLCIGVATSGHYVRTRLSPRLADLAEFIEALPEPE